MTSPDVFRSSPMRALRCEPLIVGSSSPDLPSVQDLVSQIPRRPPIRSGSKANPIPAGATSTFTSAKEHWKAAQATAENDTSALAIEAAPENAPKTRKPRRWKKTSKTANDGDASATAEPSTMGQPWKKSKPSPDSKTAREEPDLIASEQTLRQDTAIAKKAVKKTGTMSRHFQNRQGRPVRDQTVKANKEESLHLDPAPSRRVDWTPPPAKQKAIVQVDSEGAVLNDVNSSATNDEPAAVFKSLLEDYGCNEQLPRDAVTISDEDSSFLKKRKLIELVNAGDASRSASPAPEKSPTKQKAPKKKPRTITGLATAAYRPATQAEPAPQESVPNSGVGRVGSGTASNKDKTKPQGRKTAARKSKKKPPPPKPILLSPGAALKEVSRQDFVFGTSSQLAREQSPSLLRDIQAAIQNSTEIEIGNFTTPLNSDVIEPAEQRQKLWEVAARDVDGQLFDAEIINLVDDSPQRLPAADSNDPFGYFKAEGELQPAVNGTPSPHGNSFETLSDILPSPTQKKHKETVESCPRNTQTEAQRPMERRYGDSFETLSDILPSPAKQPPEIIDGGAPFSSSQISVSTDIQRHDNTTSASKTQKLPSQTPAAGAPQPPPPTSEDKPQGDASRPKYELYTDAQLSKEITSYGFKPVKRRTAMIALLDQCRQSKNHSGPAFARTITTSAGPSGDSATNTPANASPKRPRGRPRKNSSGLPVSQEPPPSAQATETPRRPRGRPRKDSTSSRGTASSRTEPPPSAQPLEPPKRPRGRPRKDSTKPSRASSPVKAKAKASGKAPKKVVPPHPSTPPRGPRAPKTVVEIPDSASENESDMFASPTPSPEQTFSPPPEVDLSVSLGEDTELSLTMTPDDKQAALFTQITEAVTSAPRSTDPTNPSWYEKMLLYDPIVLEDLALWLNSGQLTRVGYDGEISPGEVKKWCESKSICCLWRVNLRGKERKRY